MLKQSLNTFKLIQHRFNFNSTSFKTVSRESQTVSTLLFNKIQWMLKPFARGLTCHTESTHTRGRVLATCPRNMSPPHFLVCEIAAILSLLHFPATFSRYMSLIHGPKCVKHAVLSLLHVAVTCPCNMSPLLREPFKVLWRA